MNGRRQSGILLHPTSLPGPYGMGEIGPEARRFVSTLRGMGQGIWQILPLGPTGYGDSPYQSLSTFAGHPLWISLEDLRDEGLLGPRDTRGFDAGPADRVDFGPAIAARRLALRAACERFRRGARASERGRFDRWRAAQADWLDDFALFMAVKEANGGGPWTGWESALRRREPAALAAARRDLAGGIEEHRLLQYLFDRQWARLRAAARRAGVTLVGDLPIFVAHDSADVWAHPSLFQLDDAGSPTVVAGVPPDYFSETGQRWGNPLYRWDEHARSGYAWWVRRLRSTLSRVDVVRLDHFRGFAGYWEIPASEPTAVRGRWMPGPGDAFFRAVRRALGSLPIVAEDLGVITPDVDALRERHRLPGMRVLQFTVGDLVRVPGFRPEDCPPRTVLYTGTHDNDTIVGWFRARPGEGTTQTAEAMRAEREALLAYLGRDGREIHWDVIALALRSPARWAILPLQDVLGLGSEARMNRPGTTQGNWQWRFRREQLDASTRRRLLRLTRAARR
jgi:4-alpha-glucanotransferase